VAGVSHMAYSVPQTAWLTQKLRQSVRYGRTEPLQPSIHHFDPSEPRFQQNQLQASGHEPGLTTWA
jgi:hypothetical protein